MKKKTLIILGSLLILSLIGPSIAQAFSIGNVDGVWGEIDIYETVSAGDVIDVIGVIGNTSLPGQATQSWERKVEICAGRPAGTSPMLNYWDRTGSATWSKLGTARENACTTATDLFFSEHVYQDRDSDENDRVGFEIYNGTSSTVNLQDYSVRVYSSSSAFERISLPAHLLQPGGVYVLVSENATGRGAIHDLTFANHRDFYAIVLEKGFIADVRNDAECSRWVSGGTSSSRWSNEWWNQTNWPPPAGATFNQDENLVLYGRETSETYPGSGNWTQVTCANTTIDDQSGFGFDGVGSVINPQATVPFYLGQFTHYNRPVFSWTYGDQNDSNSFESVKLTVTVPVVCNDGLTGSDFQFDAYFHLDETSNTAGQCDYGSPGDTACPDKVTVTQPSELAASFECPDGDYTVNILGFTTQGLGGQGCHQSYNPASVSTEFITQELQNNSACLWAEIDEPLADLNVEKTCNQFDNDTGGDEYYTIYVTNSGPGSSIGVQIIDTLPAGANYDTTNDRKWTSNLTADGDTNPQGSCTVVGKAVTCNLLTSLPVNSESDPAIWKIEIPVKLNDGAKENTVTVSAATADPTPGNNTATATCNSTAATMVSFDAVNVEDGILLTWETAEELDNLGFNLYRAEDLQGIKVQVNPKLIPSQNPGGTSGAVYEFLDRQVVAGKEYHYWLEDIDFSLLPTLYGPVTVTR